MKMLKLAVIATPLFVLGLGQAAMSAVVVSADSPTSAAGVLKIEGNVVTQNELTSFSAQIEQVEGGYPPEGQMLINDYILTRLYDKVPTTATVAEVAPLPESSPFPVLGQRNYLKRQLRMKMMQEAEVPREDLEKWYNEHKARYERPEQVHAWHIFRETSDENETSAPEKVRAAMQQVKAEIDGGTSFSVAAEKYSEAASREKGGEIGKISPRQPIGPLNKPMNPELETVFFSLPVGKVSDVVETRHGMHLLYITDKKTTITPTVDDLVTSGILPGALAQERATSNTQELVKKTVEKHNGQVLPGFSESDTINSNTVVFELGGRKAKMSDLSQIFGDRFTNYVESIKGDTNAVRTLMEQGMEDEATVLAAVDLGLADTPEAKQLLESVARRVQATKRIVAIVDAEANVTDEDARARYEELKDQMRRPEAAGYVVQVKAEKTTETAEQARAMDEAMKKAEELADKMVSADLAAIQQEVAGADNITVNEVPRHAVHESTESLVREFDRAAGMVDQTTGVSRPFKQEDAFVVVKVTERWPGEPAPYTEVEARLKDMMKNEARMKVRQQLVDRLVEKGLVEYLPLAAEFGVPLEGDEATTSTLAADGATTATDRPTTAPAQ